MSDPSKKLRERNPGLEIFWKYILLTNIVDRQIVTRQNVLLVGRMKIRTDGDRWKGCDPSAENEVKSKCRRPKRR